MLYTFFDEVKMKLRESLLNSINKLNNDELVLLYEQVKVLEHLKKNKKVNRITSSIDDILEMTKSDQSSWSETVMHEREDRL